MKRSCSSGSLVPALVVMLASSAIPVAPAQRATRPATSPAPGLALEVADFASLPITGLPDGTGNNAGALGRINVTRQEPGPAGRSFVNDLTGPLYILDPRTTAASLYLDFNGRTRHGLFDKLTTAAGLASGIISFEFDPDYARNGRSIRSTSKKPPCPALSFPIIRRSWGSTSAAGRPYS